MKIGVYVGSFDPIHIGHIYVMDYLINHKYIDKIIIIPTNNYWDKNVNASLLDRINMIKKIKRDYLIINDELNNLPFTHQVLEELSKKYKHDELYLIMSADNIINFDKWVNYQEILKHKVIVLNRNNINIQEYVGKFQSDNFIVIQDFDFINISSTELRKSIDKKYLDKNVYKYIKKRKLYK